MFKNNGTRSVLPHNKRILNCNVELRRETCQIIGSKLVDLMRLEFIN